MNIRAFRLAPALLVALTLTLLTACGFHLRGLEDLSFQTLYVRGGGTIAVDLKRSLRGNGVTLVSNPEQAELHLDLMNEIVDKRILSLSGGGRVREFELLYRVNFRIRAAGSETWGEAQFVEGRRDYTYDDSLLLAKEGEEARLYSDMRSDASREIMRRLSAFKTNKPAAAN